MQEDETVAELRPALLFDRHDSSRARKTVVFSCLRGSFVIMVGFVFENEPKLHP
jgi:hypothetical protein